MPNKKSDKKPTESSSLERDLSPTNSSEAQIRDPRLVRKPKTQETIETPTASSQSPPIRKKPAQVVDKPIPKSSSETQGLKRSLPAPAQAPTESKKPKFTTPIPEPVKITEPKPVKTPPKQITTTKTSPANSKQAQKPLRPVTSRPNESETKKTSPQRPKQVKPSPKPDPEPSHKQTYPTPKPRQEEKSIEEKKPDPINNQAPKSQPATTKKIPSLFDVNIEPPPGLMNIVNQNAKQNFNRQKPRNRNRDLDHFSDDSNGSKLNYADIQPQQQQQQPKQQHKQQPQQQPHQQPQQKTVINFENDVDERFINKVNKIDEFSSQIKSLSEIISRKPSGETAPIKEAPIKQTDVVMETLSSNCNSLKDLQKRLEQSKEKDAVSNDSSDTSAIISMISTLIKQQNLLLEQQKKNVTAIEVNQPSPPPSQPMVPVVASMQEVPNNIDISDKFIQSPISNVSNLNKPSSPRRFAAPAAPSSSSSSSSSSPPPPPPPQPQPQPQPPVLTNNTNVSYFNEVTYDLPPIKPRDKTDNQNDSLLIIDARQYRIQPEVVRLIKVQRKVFSFKINSQLIIKLSFFWLLIANKFFLQKFELLCFCSA